jgi:hypothetical protein
LIGTSVVHAIRGGQMSGQRRQKANWMALRLSVEIM